MTRHNVLTPNVLHPLISGPEATGGPGDVVAHKRVVGDIDRNLHPHHREIPKHRDTPTPRNSPSICLFHLGNQVTNRGGLADDERLRLDIGRVGKDIN